MTNFAHKLTTFAFILLLSVFSLWLFFSPPREVISEENRAAKGSPVLSEKTLLDGSLVRDAEGYLIDALPARSAFYRLHTFVTAKIFQNSSCHGIRKGEWGLEKLLPTCDDALVSYNTEVLLRYAAAFSENTRVFCLLFPDKAAYTVDDADYRAAEAALSDAFSGYLSCYDVLGADRYFYGDIHVRPECYLPLAERLSLAMGFSLPELSVSEGVRDEGVLAKGYPLAYGEDFLTLSASDGALSGLVIENAKGEARSLYDRFAASGDPYDLYLGGEAENGILRVENRNASGNRRLLVFRDSFFRAFLPYIVKDYREILLIDARTSRYAVSSAISAFGEGELDVLFAISTHTFLTARL